MAYIGNSPENIQRGRRAVYEFTATASQTIFSGADDNGITLDLQESVENDVYLNGSRLVFNDDYTIAGEVLTLTSGAAAGDILVIVTQDDIANVASYTKAEADARYINYDGDIVNGDIQVVGNITTDGLSLSDDDLITFGSSSTKIFRTPQRNFVFRNDDNEDIFIDAQDVFLRVNRPNGFENAVAARSNGSVSLYHDAVEKLETTSTGINVTGTVTSDGLTVDGTDLVVSFNGSSKTFVYLTEGDTTDLNTKIYQSGGNFGIQTIADDLSTTKNRIKVDHSTGDISFYEDTGQTPKFFWDASAESLGIGTTDTNNGRSLVVHTPSTVAAGGTQASINNLNGNFAMIGYRSSSLANDSTVRAGAYQDDFAIYTGAAERLRIDTNGALLLGTTTRNVYYNSTTQYAATAVIKTNISNDVADLAIINGDNNFGSTIDFARTNAAGNDVRYALMGGIPTSDVAGTEAGYLTFRTKHSTDNNIVERFRVEDTGGLKLYNIIGDNRGIIWDTTARVSGKSNVQQSGGVGMIVSQQTIPSGVTTEIARTHWGGTAWVGYAGSGQQGMRKVDFGYGNGPTVQYSATWQGGASFSFSVSAYDLRVNHNAGGDLTFWVMLMGI